MTMPSETVSILLRTRDRPAFLPRALDDVLAQTFQDWRLIVIADGGDPTPVDCALRAREDSFSGRVVVLRHPTPRGHGDALNAGLEVAAGRYFTVHDDDDTWHPDFLALTVAFLSQTAHGKLAGVATNCALTRERIQDGAIVEVERLPWPLFETEIDIGNMLIRNRIPPISMLLRREIADRAGRYDGALSALEDWDFYLRILMYADIGTIDRILAFYHVRSEISGTSDDNTVVAGADRHGSQAAMLRNRAIRRAMREDPASLGVLQPLLQRLDAQNRMLTEMRRDVDNRLAHLEALMSLVHLTAAWHHKMLAPVQRLWSAAGRISSLLRRGKRAGSG